MKQIAVIAMMALAGAGGSAHAVQAPDKADSASDSDRAIKKGAHRGDEAVCSEGEATCLEKKVKNRASEANDYMKERSRDIPRGGDSGTELEK